MADQSNGAGVGSFDIGKLSSGLEEQQRVIQDRQAAQLAHAARTKQIAGESARLRKQQVKTMAPIREDLRRIEAHSRYEKQLEGGGIVDNLRIRGLRILDPDNYDPKKRRQTIADDMQRASAMAQVYGVSQQALQSELALSSARLDEQKTIEAIGHEKLTAIQNQAAIAKDNLAAHITLQETALHGMDSKELSKAIQQADSSPDGMVDVGGVPVDSETLRSRKAAMEEREYQQRWQSYERAQGEAEMADAGEVVEGQRLQRRLDHRKLLDEANARQAKTFDLTELEGIQENGYRDETGQNWNPEVINKEIEDRQVAKSAKLVRLTERSKLAAFDDDFLIDERTKIEGLQQRVREGTPLARATRAYKAKIGFAATLTGPESDDMDRAEGISIVEAAKEDFNKAVDAQVKRESGDKGMQSLLRAYYPGERLPNDSLYDTVTEKLRKNESLAGLFPADVASQVSATYKQEYGRLLKNGGTPAAAGISKDGNLSNNDVLNRLTAGGGGGSNAEERKLLQERAIQTAVQKGLESYTEQRSQVLLAKQVTDADHPLHSRWGTNQMAIAIRVSDDEAIRTWKAENQLTESQARDLLRGNQPSDLNVSAEVLTQDLVRRQDAELALRLESERPGLSKEVADWWAEHGFEYTRRTQQKSANGAVSFPEVAMQEFSGGLEVSSMEGYARRMGLAADSVTQESARRRADFLTFGSNPSIAQAAVLDADSILTPQEKQKVYREVILPLLNTAETQGMDFNTTNRFVEQQLMEVQPKSKETARLLKTLNRERAGIIQKYQKWADSASGPKGKNIGWYVDLMRDMQKEPGGNPLAPWDPLISIGGGFIAAGGSTEDYETYLQTQKPRK